MSSPGYTKLLNASHCFIYTSKLVFCEKRKAIEVSFDDNRKWKASRFRNIVIHLLFDSIGEIVLKLIFLTWAAQYTQIIH